VIIFLFEHQKRISKTIDIELQEYILTAWERRDFIVDVRVPALRFRRARRETKLWLCEGPSIDSRDLDEFSEIDRSARPSTKSVMTTLKIEDARKLVGRTVTRETAVLI